MLTPTGQIPVSGLDVLVHRLDRAVQSQDLAELAGNVQKALQSTIGESAVELPEPLRRTREEAYARRLLHRSEAHGYTLIAMIWGPSQGTAVHDHAGIWCVEGVFEGTIEVVQYDLLEEVGESCRFRQDPMVMGEVGSAGSLIPPYEYHTIQNASSEICAITLHVYGGEMDEACVFEPTDREGWYLRRRKKLYYTD